METTTEKNPQIKAMNKAQLAALYEITPHILRTWFKPHLETIGEFTGGVYTPKQIKKIFEIFGEP